MPSHPLNYLLLDKDETLGDFRVNPTFYPSVIEFLTEQHNADRNLVIITTAPAADTKQHLQPINSLLHAYLCRENFRIQDQFATIIKDFYLDHNGQIQELKDAKTPSQRYENPYSPNYYYKDLHLARRYLDSKNYKTLRTIMLGDKNDAIAAKSDPFTPLIIISNQQRNGNWQPVTHLLNQLYHDQNKEPWKIFDEINEQLLLHPKRRQQLHCKTKKDPLYGRIILMDE